MSSKTLQLKIITPEKLIYEGEVNEVTLPTQDGVISVLPGHMVLMSALASGDIVATHDGEQIPFAVAGGFLEVKPVHTGDEGMSIPGMDSRTQIIILADFAEHVSSIGEEEIAKAKARAEELQKQKDNNEVIDFEHFESELARSLTRVKIADKWRNRKYRI